MHHRHSIAAFIALAFLSAGVAARSSASNDKAYYLALRTDGKPGSGTSLDPYDCGTEAKFDAVVGKLPGACNIYLGAGTFNTAIGVVVKAGQRWHGQGMDMTAVRLAPSWIYRGGNGPVVFRNNDPDASGAEVADLTADGNQQNLGLGTRVNPNICVDAVNLNGGGIRIRNVHATNCYGAGTGECFPIAIDSLSNRTKEGGPFDGSEISGCVLDHVAGSNVTGVAMFGQTQRQAGLIAGNLVSGVNGCAYAAGGDGVKIVNNTARDCAAGFYIDTGQFNHGRIIGNTFLGIKGPGIMVHTAGGADGVLVADNYIEEKEVSCGVLMYGTTNLTVMGNTIKYTGNSLPVSPAFTMGKTIWIGNTVIPGTCKPCAVAMQDGAVNINNESSAFRTATFGSADPNLRPVGNRSVTVEPPQPLPPSPDTIQSGISLTIDGNSDYGAFLGSVKLGASGSPLGLALGTRHAGTDTRILTLLSDGFVGINNVNPRSALDVNGTAHISGILSTGPSSAPVTDSSGKILSAALNTVALAQGGTGARDAVAARANLGARKTWVAAPAHGNDPGQEGDEAFDGVYHYIYHAGSWLRSAAYSGF